MKFIMVFQVEGDPYKREESYDVRKVRGLKQAREWSEKAIREFNATVEEGEKRRTLLEVKKHERR